MCVCIHRHTHTHIHTYGFKICNHAVIVPGDHIPFMIQISSLVTTVQYITVDSGNRSAFFQ